MSEASPTSPNKNSKLIHIAKINVLENHSVHLMSENSPSNPTYQIEIKNNQYHLKEFGVYFFGQSQVQSEFIHPNVHPSINLKKNPN